MLQPIKFYCSQCQESLDNCDCPDLEERFKARFWKSSIYNEAMAAVSEALKKRREREKLERERQRKAS
jgi:hypothetical protein